MVNIDEPEALGLPPAVKLDEFVAFVPCCCCCKWPLPTRSISVVNADEKFEGSMLSKFYF